MEIEIQPQNETPMERIELLFPPFITDKKVTAEEIATQTASIVELARLYDGFTYKRLFKTLYLTYSSAEKATGISRSTISRFLAGKPVKRVALIRYALQSYLTAHGMLAVDSDFKDTKEWLLDAYKRIEVLWWPLSNVDEDCGSWKYDAAKKIKYAAQTLRDVLESIQKLSTGYDPEHPEVFTYCSECEADYIGYTNGITPNLCPDCESYQRKSSYTLSNVREETLGYFMALNNTESMGLNRFRNLDTGEIIFVFDDGCVVGSPLGAQHRDDDDACVSWDEDLDKAVHEAICNH